MTIQYLRKQFEKQGGQIFFCDDCLAINREYTVWLEHRYLKLYHRREEKIQYIHVKGYPENGN